MSTVGNMYNYRSMNGLTKLLCAITLILGTFIFICFKERWKNTTIKIIMIRNTLHHYLFVKIEGTLLPGVNINLIPTRVELDVP